MTDAPLIVTLRFDDAGFEHFDAARRQHFPAGRNHIPAHLTLFHHLPDADEPRIAATLRDVAKASEPLSLRVTGLRFLGYGCAYVLECPGLIALRKDLADTWRGDLTPQDAAPFKPHVTIQNKAPAAEAKHLFAELQARFQPFEVGATGLLLWRYRGGPWEAAGAFPFDG